MNACVRPWDDGIPQEDGRGAVASHHVAEAAQALLLLVGQQGGLIAMALPLSLQRHGQVEAHHVVQGNLVSLLVRAGRFLRPEREARSLAEGAPTFAPGLYRLGRALESLGRMDEAIREYAATVRLDPSHREAREALRARPSP